MEQLARKRKEIRALVWAIAMDDLTIKKYLLEKNNKWTKRSNDS